MSSTKKTTLLGRITMREVDALTATTSKHFFSLDDSLKLNEDQSFNFCVEINAFGAPSETYTDEHVGQPSLYYITHFNVEYPINHYALEPVEYVGNAVKNATIHYCLDDITTAKELLDISPMKVNKVESMEDRAE